MFERFTRESREVVVGAQQQARRLAAPKITTTHLLLALLDIAPRHGATIASAGADLDALGATLEESASGALDGKALAAVGIDLDAVTARAEGTFGKGALRHRGRSPAHLPFAREAKKCLEFTLREAARLQDRSLTSRHLLLAMLRTDCTAGHALLAAGADIALLRRQLEATPGAQAS